VEVENSELRQRLALLQSRVSQNEADLALLRTKNAKRRESISSLQQFIDTERRGYQQQSENVDDIKKSYAQLQETCRQQEESIALLRKRESRLAAVDVQAVAAAKEADDLRVQLEAARADLTRITETSSQALQSVETARESLLVQLQQAEEEAKKQEDRAVSLEGDMIILDQSYNGVRDELADQSRRLTTLQSCNEQLENGIANLRSERQSNTKLIALLQKDLKQAETSLSHCRTDNDNLHNKVLRLDDEVFAMQSKLEPLKSELSRAEKSIAYLTEDKAKLQQTVTSLREERYKLEERLISVEEEKSSLEREITSLNEENAELQQELEARTAEVRSMMARRVSIEGANEAMGVAVTVEKRIKEVLIEDRKRLQECVNVLELEKEEFVEDIKVLKDDIDALNKELTASKIALDKCKKDFDRLRMEKVEGDLLRDRLEKDRLELQAENNQLHADHVKMEELINYHANQAATIIPNLGAPFTDVAQSAPVSEERGVPPARLPSIRYTTPDGAAVEPSSDIYAGMMQLSDELVAARSTIMSLQEHIEHMNDEIYIQQQQQHSTAQAQVIPYAM
jgi:chromosome segregation ATPase